MLLTFVIIFLTLIVAEALFVAIARRLDITDKANKRSSHTGKAVTGGGFIFFPTLVATLCIYFPDFVYTPLTVGCAVLFVMCLADKRWNLSPQLRLVVQTIVMLYAFGYIAANGYVDIYIIVVICAVGFVNAYNFMDGINGMLAAYSIVTLLTLWMLYTTCPYTFSVEMPIDIIETMLLAVIAFSLFNFRRRALTFAGDVGSICLGFIVAWLAVNYIILTAEASIIVFFMVYAVDTVLTIINRLFLGENILTSHRLHLYQRLTTRTGDGHLATSMTYAGLQLVINAGWFLIPRSLGYSYLTLVTVVLIALYFVVRAIHKNHD